MFSPFGSPISFFPAAYMVVQLPAAVSQNKTVYNPDKTPPSLAVNIIVKIVLNLLSTMINNSLSKIDRENRLLLLTAALAAYNMPYFV